MATYLQGVTDYIPQFQPFQPDLNFYANIMQTKQTQYDTNWKSLNKMYGQYYHADLTRDENVEKRDKYLKDIEFNLKRVSQMDLSLEQNVGQATQIFKPFYEDKGLMKDMAWTKNFNNQYGMAQSYQNAYDDKQRAKYWDTGLKEMNYMKDEFKAASSEKAMSFGNVQYTPYVNVIEKAQKLAKDSGLSIESVDFSKDGRWIVKSKNGEQLIEPLSKLFEAQLGSDAAIQAVYKTQSYVNRKDYAYSNAAQFGGDKDKAEMKYLEDSFNVLKSESAIRHKKLVIASQTYDKKIADLQKQVDNKTASPDVEAALANYKMNKDINDKVLSRSEEEQNLLNNDQSSTATTTTGFKNPYGDIESLRWKVDNGMASKLMQKDLDEAANIFAFKDAKQDIQANPYAVNEQKHAFSMQQIASRNAGLARAAQIRNAGERKNQADKFKVENGTHYYDENGNAVAYEGLNEMFTEPNDKGNATGRINLKTTSRMIAQMQTKQVAQPYLQNTVQLIEKFVEEGVMSKDDAQKILGYGKNQKVDYVDFSRKLNSEGYKFIRGEVGSKDLFNIKNKMDNWLSQNKALSGMDSEQYKQYRDSSLKFGDYTRYLKADQDWRKQTSYEVERELSRQGLKNTRELYDEAGNLRTREEYFKALSEKGVKSSGGSNRELKMAEYRTAMKEMNDLTKEYMGGKSGSAFDIAQARKKMKNDPRVQEIIAKKQRLSKELGGVSLVDVAGASRDYDDLVKAAGKVYTSGRIKKPLPGLSQLGEMSGSGLFTPSTNTTWVNPKDKSNSTKGNMWGIEAINDINKIDWGASDKNRVTFSGITKTAWDKGGRNDAGLAILNAIKKEMMTNKTKMGNFTVGVSPIALNSNSKAAVIIKPDAEWLKGYVYTTKDGKATSAGIISQDQYNAIMQNGISYITDANNLSSDLYTRSYQSPLQSYVDYYGSYKYHDPANPDYSFEIQKSKTGTNDYMVKANIPLYNPDTGETVMTPIADNASNMGSNLEQIRFSTVTGMFDKYKDLNKQLKNGNY
jgi:hypothetical protein